MMTLECLPATTGWTPERAAVVHGRWRRDIVPLPRKNSLLGTLHQVEGRLVPNLDSANILQQSGVSVELRECELELDKTEEQQKLLPYSNIYY